MTIPHQSISVDIYRLHPLTVDLIGHVNDKNTRYLELQLTANDEPITLELGCSAFVTYATDGILIAQDVECDVDNSKIIICFDSEVVEEARSGIMQIQPKVVDSNDNEITLQIPINVRISPDLAQISGISEDSLGSYAEVVQEIAEARGDYENLNERLRHTGAPTDEQVAEAVEEYLDEHPKVESIDNKKTEITNQSHEGDSDTNYPTVGAVRDYVHDVKEDLEDYIDDELLDLDTAKADKANSLAGYGITDAYTKDEVDALVDPVHSYVQNEADRVTAVVANHQGNRTFNIGMITDMHIYSDNPPESTATDTYYNYFAARHACQGMARISKSIHMNAFAMLGDYIGGDNGFGYNEGVVKINRLASEVDSDRDIRLIGNHDYGFRVNQGYAPTFVYPFVTAYNAGMVMGDIVKGYGYYDNEEYNLRIIALNTTEYDGVGAPAAEYNISTAQKIWFANALDMSAKSDPSEWQVLILSHHPLDWSTSSAAAETDAVSILKAYKNGSTVTIGSTTVDFANKNSAIIIGNVHGHLHNYLSGTIYGTNYKRWCCPSACFDSTNRYYDVWRESTTYSKTIRSAEDTAFAVFSIDLDNYTVSRIHYGAGYDTLDDVYYTPSTGYTNLVPTSIEGSSGNIYNGTGYADGYRIGSSGSPSEYSGSVATGYIAAERGDTIRFKGVDWNVSDTGSTHSGKCYFVECDSSFSVIGAYRNDQQTLTKDGDVYSLTVGYTNTAYIRLSGIGSGTNLIVTKNEVID